MNQPHLRVKSFDAWCSQQLRVCFWWYLCDFQSKEATTLISWTIEEPRWLHYECRTVTEVTGDLRLIFTQAAQAYNSTQHAPFRNQWANSIALYRWHHLSFERQRFCALWYATGRFRPKSWTITLTSLIVQHQSLFETYPLHIGKCVTKDDMLRWFSSISQGDRDKSSFSGGLSGVQITPRWLLIDHQWRLIDNQVVSKSWPINFEKWPSRRRLIT